MAQWSEACCRSDGACRQSGASVAFPQVRRYDKTAMPRRAGHVFPSQEPTGAGNSPPAMTRIHIEPFAGSGTTILAGQRTGRVVRAIEHAPAYVDLAIARFRVVHPDLPVSLDGDGRDLDAIAAERTAAEVADAA